MPMGFARNWREHHSGQLHLGQGPEAISNKCIASSNKCLTSRNKDATRNKKLVFFRPLDRFYM